MKIIEIGDLHVKKDNIEESKRFIQWLSTVISRVKNENNELSVIFLGDQFNDFGIARVEVIEFWTWATNFLCKFLYPSNIVYLVGNHDRNSEGTETAMKAFSDKGVIVDKDPVRLNSEVGAIGFLRDNSEFEEKARSLYKNGARIIYCHQEFNGAKFETGMYAPHGVDPAILPPDLKFRVGHFHAKQSFGNISYVGTPRHLTKSDIGETKGIHIFDLKTKTEEFIPTPDNVCEPLVQIVIKEGESLPEAKITNKTYIELCGTKEWCKKTEKQIPQGTKVNCSYTDIVKEIKIKESDGIPLSFMKFFETQEIPSEIKDEVLRQIYENCPQLKGVM